MNAPAGPRFIFHIVPETVWRSTGAIYESDTLQTEGFIHCSTAEQVYDTAELHFAGRSDLVLLRIDTARVEADIRYENLVGGSRQFPHVYGPLERTAIREALPLALGEDGRFVRSPLPAD